MKNHQTNPLKRLAPRLLVAVLALFALTVASHAAVVTFANPVAITADTDVSTSGTLIFAYDWANVGQVVNTVPFTGSASTTTVGANLTLSGWTGANNTSAFTSASAPFSALSSAYRAILIGSDFTTSGTAATVTLTNLTVGHSYLVQMWVNDPRPSAGRNETVTSGGNTVTLMYSTNNVAGSPGEYTIGTFTADGTSQIITNISSASTQINALQLRDTTAITAYYWDQNGNAAGLGGTGAWDTTSSFWTTDSTGASGSTVYPNATGLTLADFAGTAGTVTIASGTAANVNAITFGTTGYTLAGADSTATLTNGSGEAALTITTGAGNTETINAIITDPTALTKTADSGTLVLGGVNIYSGVTTIGAGTLTIGGAGQLGGGTYAGNIADLGGFNYNSSAAQTLSGVISGPGTLTQLGSGALTLSGVNTYSGATTISAGTLTMGGAGKLANGTIITNNSSFIYNSSAAQTLSGIISGTGTLTQLGSGTLTLSGANTYSGATTISAGTLTAGNNAAFGTGVVNLSGGTAVVSSRTITNTFAATAATSSTINFGGNATLSGPLTGSGSLKMAATSASSLYPNGDMSGYSGAIAIDHAVGNITATTSGGAASSNTGSTAAAFTITNSTGTTSYSFTLNTGTYNMGSLTGNGKISGGSATLSVGTLNTPTTFAGTLNSSLGLTKVGSSTLTLSANNSYTGGTTVNGGVLELNSSGTYTYSGGGININNGSTFRVSGSRYDFYGKSFTFDSLGGGTIDTSSGLNWVTWTAATFTTSGGAQDVIIGASGMNLNSGVAATFNVARGSGSSDLKVSAYLWNGGSVIKTGNGILELAATNTYTGTTTVSNGTLLVSGSLSTGAVTVKGGILNGTGTVNGATTVNSGGTLAAGTAAGMGTLSISNALAMNSGGTNWMRLNKTGATLTSDLVQGVTTLNYGGGTLTVTATGDALAAGDTFTLFNSSSYTGVFASYNLPALPTGLSWDKSQLAVNGSITVVAGTGTPSFNPPAGGYVGAQSVTISSDTGSRIFYTVDGSTPTTASPSGLSPVTGLTIPLNITETIKAFATNSGTTPSAVASATYVTVPTAIWTNTAGGSWVVASNWNVGAIGNGSGVTADFSTLTLTANTTVTVPSPVTIGTMLFADQANAYGWLLTGVGPLTVDAGASVPTLVVSNQVNISTPIAGTNGLAVSGPGTLTLSGSKTYTGTTTVAGGTLIVDNLSGTSSMQNNSSGFAINGASTLTLKSTGGSGGRNSLYGKPIAFDATGGGTVSILSGNQEWCGTMTTSGGAQDQFTGNSINMNTGAGTVTFNVARGTDAVSDLNVAVVLGNDNTGSGGLVKTGSGILTLSGADYYTHSTTVSNGTLIVSGTTTTTGAFAVQGGTLEVDGSLGTSAVTIYGGSLAGTGTINGAVTVQSGGILAAGTPAGTGTLYINNALTLNAGSTNLMRISKTGGSPSYDSLNGMTGFARAGTLTVTNITSNGNHLAAGDTFYLFSGSGYSGTFATINLPVLDAGLSWDLSGLYTGGSIFVSANAATPIFTPTPGNYAGALPVTITSESGATIHYTTDGSDPTTSGTVLSAASPATVTIPAETASLTITAYATKSGEGNSGNASATYSTIGTMTWITPADGSWSGTYNWSNNLVASGPGVTADFSTLTLTANTTVTLDTPTTVGNLVFGDQGDAFNWILANGGVGPLTLNNGTNASVITVVNTNTTIAATLAGTNGLAKAGAGTLTLSGTNTYTGATIISNATLIVSSPANLNSALPSAVNITNPGILAVAAGGTGQTFANAVSGAGTVNYSGTGENRLAGDWSGFTGILDINTSGGGKLDDQTTTTPFGSAATVNIATGASFYLGNSNTYANTFAIIGTGNTENRGALRLDSGVITGNVQLLGNATIGNSSGSGSGGSTISGVISGGYVLQTAGTWGSVANLTLAGANTYSGGTAISAGWLKVGNPAALGTGPVALTGGKLDLNATNLNLQNLSGTGGLITDLQTNEPAAVTSTLTVNQVADNTFAGTIQNGTSNSVGLVKIGSAALILSGINTYTGLTTVSNGTLEVNGAIGASAVTVKAPATLAGTGTIGGAVTVNGTLSAGTNGLGALTINNNLTLNAGSTATLAIDRTAGTATYGKVQGITTATFGGTLTVTSLGGTFVNGDTFPLFSATSHIGNFTATNLPALGAGLGWQWTPASGVLSVVASGPSGPAAITNHISGSTLTLTWPAGQGWRLVGQTNSLSTGLSTNWGTVPGVSDGSATITVDPAKPTVFYRLVYP